MCVENNPPAADVVPCKRAGAPLRLRVPWSGRLGELEGRYAAKLPPNFTGWQGYDRFRMEESRGTALSTIFAPDLIVLRRLEGRPLGLESTLILTEALRGAS